MLLLNGLRNAGHESVLLARGNGALRKLAEDGGFVVHPASLTGIWRRSGSVDLVHAHDAKGHTLAALASRRKFVVSRRVAFAVKRGPVSRWKYSRATRFLAVSRFVAAELEKAGIDREIIDIVFDGVELDGALQTWNSQFPAVALALTDPLKGRDLVEQAARQAGIPVVFSDNLTRDFQRASMFVYITRTEGLGSAALLAMRMGVPVIASRVGGVPEVIGPSGDADGEVGEAGILVENEIAEIAAAMQSLRANEARSRALIERGCRRIENLFAAEHLVRRTLASYGRALAG
jgi:glycosyltransferase involved in cell wall biosynthesis